MKSKMLCNVFALMVLTASLSSCEKIPSESAGSESKTMPNVVLRVGQIEQIPFDSNTRADADIVCNKLCFDIYDKDGQKVEYLNQKKEDENFGEASFSLEEGEYYLVVIGHSAVKTPSFATKEMKVTASGALSDMFWVCEPLNVTEGDIHKNLTLKRIVSMVRFIPNDAIPEEANEIYVEYKGSKGTFSALTGYGTTTSTQKITLEVAPSDEQIDFYMIPRQDDDVIDNVKVISRLNDGSTAKIFSEKDIESIPVRRNCITICRGNLFDNESSSHTSYINIAIDDTWGEAIQFSF